MRTHAGWAKQCELTRASRETDRNRSLWFRKRQRHLAGAAADVERRQTHASQVARHAGYSAANVDRPGDCAVEDDLHSMRFAQLQQGRSAVLDGDGAATHIDSWGRDVEAHAVQVRNVSVDAELHLRSTAGKHEMSGCDRAERP